MGYSLIILHNAFFEWLYEDMYISQPKGFIDSTNLSLVCMQVKKSPLWFEANTKASFD